MQNPTASQTRHSLSNCPQAAWLWDCDRNRIVWANRAAIALFEGQSLFDVIDRPFDPAEPAVIRLGEVKSNLQVGQTLSSTLDFFSLGSAGNVTATLALHDLADGRKGLLVIVEPVNELAEIPADILQQAFTHMPQAAVFITDNGTLVHPNAAAREILPSQNATALDDLLVSGENAARILAQLQNRNLVTTIEKLHGRIGIRDVRLTFRRLECAGYLAIANLEDVTERRLIEMQFAEPAAELKPPDLISRNDAFDKLAKSLKETINGDQLAAPKPQAVTTPQKHPPSEPAKKREVVKPPALAIPETIRKAMERSGEAVLIVRNNKIAFATSRAGSDYGLAAGEDAEALHILSGLPGPISSTELFHRDGSAVSVEVSVKTVPWHDGPAKQYIIRRSPASQRPERRTDHDEPPPPSFSTAAEHVDIVVAPDLKNAAKSPIRVPTASANITMSRMAPVSASPDLGQNTAPDDELKAILDVASDGIITLDEAGNILSFSAGAEAIFGRGIRDVVDKPMAHLLTPESRKTWLDYLAALQGPGLASVFNDGREVLASLVQGGTVPLFLTLGKLQSAKSRARFCAVVRDITPWKRTEKELRDAKESAEKASRQKSVFLAHISHELRTPLNAIMGFSEVMQQEKFGALANDKYRGYAGDIHASGKHLLSLIDDLLDLSRIEAGKQDLNFVAVSLAEVTEHAVRMLQAEAASRRVVLRLSFGKDVPLVVADQRSLRQVMMNLLSNAIKFTEAGGQVIMSAQSLADGALVWRVKDTGLGMSAEHITAALEPFKRIATEGRETQGTGLGLPLAKALVEANRATFNLSSTPGKGTLVEITFPTPRVLAD